MTSKSMLGPSTIASVESAALYPPPRHQKEKVPGSYLALNYSPSGWRTGSNLSRPRLLDYPGLLLSCRRGLGRYCPLSIRFRIEEFAKSNVTSAYPVVVLALATATVLSLSSRTRWSTHWLGSFAVYLVTKRGISGQLPLQVDHSAPSLR